MSHTNLRIEDQAPIWAIAIAVPMIVVSWAWGLALLALLVAGPFLILGWLFS